MKAGAQLLNQSHHRLPKHMAVKSLSSRIPSRSCTLLQSIRDPPKYCHSQNRSTIPCLRSEGSDCPTLTKFVHTETIPGRQTTTYYSLSRYVDLYGLVSRKITILPRSRRSGVAQALRSVCATTNLRYSVLINTPLCNAYAPAIPYLLERGLRASNAKVV